MSSNSNQPPLVQLTSNIEQFAEDQDPCISSLAVSGSVLAATKLCGEVALFDLEKVFSDDNNESLEAPTPFVTFKAHRDALNACKFLSSKIGNGAYLATCGDDSSVRIFDCKNINDGNRGYPIALYPAPAEVNCVCESTDGRRLYAGCDDGSVVTYTFGGFADATTLSNAALNNKNNNSNNQNDNGNEQSYNALNPYPLSAPPAQVDRFLVGEGSVNDILIINLPYGDILFTATDDGCVRAWRTQPGQRAPNEPQINLPSRDQMNQDIDEAANDENGNADGENGNDDCENENGALKLREVIQQQLGDESADRLITSFDMLQGGQINHIVNTTIGNQPVILVAATNFVFAVAFDIGSGQLNEEPSILFNGNDDFVRGILPTAAPSSSGNNNNNSVFYTVADDGTVAMFTRNLENQQEPVGAVKKFNAERQGLNIMSSVLMKNDSVLVTGSLLGSIKMWKL